MVTFSEANSRYQDEQGRMNDDITAHSGGPEKEKRFMKKLAVFASLWISVLVPQVKAQSGCSNGTLWGVYSFVASGTFGSSPFAAAGQTTYDGAGGVTGVIQISVNGSVTPVTAWSGSYAVKPDCTFTKTAIIPGVGTVHFFGTAANGFTELRFIASDTGTAIAGTARKQ